MEFMPDYDIIKAYKSGRRDFSNIECRGGNFSSADLKGIIFRESNLTGSSFSGAKLDDSDFEECILQWTNFDHASLRRANFGKSDLSWMKATEPIFENTSFTGANLSWAYIFNANMGQADFANANTQTMATSFSQMHEAGLLHGEDELRNVGLPASAAARIRSGISKMKERWNESRDSETEANKNNDEVKKSEYNIEVVSSKTDSVYGRKNDSIYNENIEYGRRKKK
jgi:hypothetical protein